MIESQEMPMTEEILIEQLKGEGYHDLEVEGFAPDADVAEHTHDKYTIQRFTAGEITVTDTGGDQKTYRAGDDMISPPGTTHHAKAGPEGCTFVVGYK